MKRASVIAGLVALALASAGGYAANVSATPSSGVTTTILAKSTYGAFAVSGRSIPANAWAARIRTRGLSDLYVVDNKFTPTTTVAAGGTTGWHSHPGPSFVQVIAGTVTNYTGDDPVTNYTGDAPTCTGHTYGAGEGFIDPGGNDVHLLRNEGTEPAETIAVQLLPNKAPRRTEQPAPPNCHL